ncbi:MAG: hypothetical protein IJB34_00290 [Clostridia bacterium]|nr:hypothetical protein [Clostridia bacterium]
MRKLKIGIAIFAITVLSLLGFACKKSETAVEIDGVKNIECSYTLVEYDLLSGVTSSNGEEVELSGEVQFGIPGEYFISYTCGDTTVNATVRIYGEPEVKSATDITTTYENVLSGDVENGIAVTDTFGGELNVEFIGFAEEIDYPKYGSSYTAKYQATDKVGHTKEFTRKITVQTSNIAFDDATVDVADDSYAFALNGVAFTGLYDKDGNAYASVYESDGKLYNLNAVGAILGEGNHTLTIVGVKGYDDICLTVTDSQPFAYSFDYADEDTGIENYIWAAGEEVTFPAIISKKGTYQKFDVQYSLYYQGEKYEFYQQCDEAFSPMRFFDLGEYTYVAQITRKGETTTVENKFYIVSEKEKLNYSYSTLSNQFVSAWMPYEDYGSSVKYVRQIEDSNGTTYNAIEFENHKIKNADGELRALRFNTTTIEEVLNSGSTTITMDVLLKEDFADPVYIFAFLQGNSGKWDCSPNTQYAVNAKEWRTISFDLSSCWVGPNPSAPDFYSVDYYGRITINWKNFGLIVHPFNGVNNKDDSRTTMGVYIANVRFGETKSIEEKNYYGFEGEAGSRITLSQTGLTANINGVEEAYENLYFTENGLVKQVIDNVSSPLAYPTLAEIKGEELWYKGKNYVSLSYESGAILNVGKAEMPAYGEALIAYGCTTKYELWNLSTGMKVKTLASDDMFVTLTKTGGYNLKLTVKYGNLTMQFDNYMYAKDETDFINALIYSNIYLRYSGKAMINGEIKDAFKVERVGGDVEGHRYIQLKADYVDKMLDAGITTLTIGVKTDTRTGLQKVHRILDNKATTQSDGTLKHGADYWMVSENSQYQEVELSLDESMKGKTFGFSLKKDGYIYINEPLFGVDNGDIYQNGNDYGLDDIY